MIRTGYDDYYRHLGLTPELVGLSQAAIVSGVALLLGVVVALVVTWTTFGMVAYRLVSPLRSRRTDGDRSWRESLMLGVGYLLAISVVSIPAWLARRVFAAEGFALWTAGAAYTGLIAIQLSWVLADTELRIGQRLQEATRSAYAGQPPRIARLLASTIVIGLSVGWTLDFLRDAARAGQVVHDTGRLPAHFYLNVTTSPARVIPKGDDPLKVCGGDRRAVLVGRHNGISYVLLLPDKDPGPPSEVVPLSDGDYAVATATITQPTCGPSPPTP